MRLSCSTSVIVVVCVLLLFAAPGSPVCAQIQYPSLTIPDYQSAPVYDSPSVPVPGSSRAVPKSYAPPRAGDFSMTVRTELLTPFVNRETVESDNVATRVMEADVRGVQTTATSVRLQSLVSSVNARLHIQSTGTVSSNTIGYTRQAQVATLGNHTFDVIKPVFFDGRRFLTKQAYGALQVRQVPQAVTTVASGMPLLWPIGERMAWNEVYRRMPMSDSIVARRSFSHC